MLTQKEIIENKDIIKNMIVSFFKKLKYKNIPMPYLPSSKLFIHNEYFFN